jgi:hypothetical protein
MKVKYFDIFLTVSLLVGVLTGLISAHTLFAHSITAIYFWGIIGLILGALIPNSKARVVGLAYGFSMMLSFLLFGFQGQRSSLLGFIVLAIGLSLVSAFCGWLAVYVGVKIKLYFTKRKE